MRELLEWKKGIWLTSQIAEYHDGIHNQNFRFLMVRWTSSSVLAFKI